MIHTIYDFQQLMCQETVCVRCQQLVLIVYDVTWSHTGEKSAKWVQWVSIHLDDNLQRVPSLYLP